MRPDEGKLPDPPIIEVVCGITFNSVRELDPVLLGAFWRARRSEFPRREYKAPIAVPVDGFGFSIGPDIGPVRTWLISKNDVFIIQVQHDRFYLNWRKRQEDYPRFNDRHGEPPGMLNRFLRELELFEAFLKNEANTSLEITGIELAKLDRLTQGRHWNGVDDLIKLIPMLETPLKAAPAGDPTFQIRVGAPSGGQGRTEVILDGAESAGRREVRVDFRSTRSRSMVLADVEASMKQLNDELNELFRRVIPEQRRFERDWRPA